MKKWAISSPSREGVTSLLAHSNLSPLCARVLCARGMENITEIGAFLQCDSLSDPFLMTDMEAAITAITDAVDAGEKICIYGDYDCDGVMSTAILYTFLQSMGANVYYRLPEREEGYGLHPEVVAEMHSEGVSLVLAVDNGITAHEEAKLIAEYGMKLVIIDHHQPLATLPLALAVVNPHRADDTSPFVDFCGAGLALKVVGALLGDMHLAFEQFGELSAIATIADVVPLSGENRYIVKHGLPLHANTERVGLLALLDSASLTGKTLTEASISFGIAPRINAAGRFGTPRTALELVLSEDPENARDLSYELETRNNNRKKAEDAVIDEIAAQVNQNPALIEARVLLFAGEGWHHGIVGIVAARLLERFGKPAIVVAIEGDIARGSMRSFGDFSAFHCLDACSEVLMRYGGHHAAGGFTLSTDKIDAFRATVEAYAAENYPDMPLLTQNVDLILSPADFTLEAVDSLSVLAPFGAGNPTPQFAICRAKLLEIRPLSGGKHTKLCVLYGQRHLELLLFRHAPDAVGVSPSMVCDFLVTAETNTYNGVRSLSLVVQDYRRSGIKQSAFFAAWQTYEKYRRGEKILDAYYASMTPTREELTTIYKNIPQKASTIDALYMRVQDVPQMNYCKYRLALDVFEELHLVAIDRWQGTASRLSTQGKVDLNTSTLLQNLVKAREEIGQ